MKKAKRTFTDRLQDNFRAAMRDIKRELPSAILGGLIATLIWFFVSQGR